jgi:hypothetical protein
MERARPVGYGFFPLDDELALLPGRLAPRQQEHLVRLATSFPFLKVATLMNTFFSIQIHGETVRQVTERMGSAQDAVQGVSVSVPRECESTCEPLPVQPQCVFSVDGSIISLVQRQWAEIRLLAIGKPYRRVNAKNESEIHVGELSYFSRMDTASTFTMRSAAEMQRRHVMSAQQASAISDGAEWCQDFTNAYRSDAVRILDFYHVKEHLRELLEALERAGVPLPAHTLDRYLHVLKHRGPRSLFRLADRIGPELAQKNAIRKHLDYLRKREALMQYPRYQREGLPIGSGAVESANASVVQARMKGSGMHWERKNVNPMLALRTSECSDRWEEMWGLTCTHLDQQLAHHRFFGKTHPNDDGASQKNNDSLVENSTRQKPQGEKAKRYDIRTPSYPNTPFVKGTCPGCGIHVEPAQNGGQNKRYCSPHCRQRGHAWRKRQAMTA